MTNKYTVIVSERASKMIINNVRFLANVSVEAARKLHKEIITGIKELEFMPESFPWLISNEIPANKYRKKLVAKRYLLIYQIKDNTVFVDYVLDCRQDYKWFLQWDVKIEIIHIGLEMLW